MQLRNKLRFLALAAAAALATVAIACSSDDDDEPASTGGASTGAAATATTAPSTGGGSTGGGGGTGASSSGAGGTGSTGAAGEGVDVTLQEDALGSYLVDADGMTLYVFLRDAPDTTNCTDSCLTVWPPMLLEDGQEVEAGEGIEGEFGSIDTPSGTQVTYNQVPLYYFAGDSAPGQTNGHLVEDIWFVVREDTASTSIVVVNDGGAEPFLVGPTGMTLYTFDNDTEGVSNCSGTCLENWPALTTPQDLPPAASEGADGALSTVTRDDGTVQVTYDGMPLYYYIGDKLPGDTTGDGVGGVWHTALP